MRYFVYDEELREDYLIEYGETHARRWLNGKRRVHAWKVPDKPVELMSSDSANR